MKKIISMAAITAFFIMSIYVFGEAAGNLSYDAARNSLIQCNPTIKKMQNAEKQAYLQYADSELQALTINPKGFTYDGDFIEYDLLTRIQLTQLKELTPEQMKNAWEACKENCSITENKLLVRLRDVYLELVSASNQLKIEESKLALAKKTSEADKMKLAKGLITNWEADSSDYAYLKAIEDRNAAARNKENSMRNLNLLVGNPISNTYENIEYMESLSTSKFESLDFYTNKALASRQEITTIQKDIALKEHLISIIEQDKNYISYPDAVKSRQDAIFDLEILKSRLDKEKYDIIKEIKNAYIDVIKQTGDIKSLKNALDAQKLNLKKATAQYGKGLITSGLVDGLRIDVSQAENAYYEAIFKYNTSVIKLENASGLGPAYSN